MRFLRMLSVWDCETFPSFDDLSPSDRYRLTPGIYGNLVTVMSELELESIKTKFTQLKRKGLRCRSVKLFFEGTIPDLSEKGLVQKGVTWLYPHDNIHIAAVPYGKHEWCFMIEKRNGAGVPLHALDFVPLMEHQMEWREVL